MNIQNPMKSADNGVDVEALYGIKKALTEMPPAAQFTWRARCEWLGGVHSKSTVETFFGAGAEQTHKVPYSVEADHPVVFAAPDAAATPVEIVLSALASCLTGGVAAIAQHRGEALKELALQQTGAVDPNSITIREVPPEPTALIEGSLNAAGDTISWAVEMRDRASGEEMALSEGSVPADQVWEISERVARDMLEAACPRKGFAVTATIDDLVIDTEVCDYSGPFEIVSKPGGASATISFAPTAATAGTYTYAGQVAGAPASGAGTYVIDLTPDGTGTLVIDGVFSVTSPMGTFSATGPETMVLSPPSNACG
jgi:hypothetical protein